MAEELGRRYKRYLISPETFFGVLKRKIVISNVFPSDATARALVYDPSKHCIELYVESEMFPLIPFGETIPDEDLKAEIIKVWDN